jgi:hypothetical protein
VGGRNNVWQPYVGIGSGIMVELLLAQFLIGIDCAILLHGASKKCIHLLNAGVIAKKDS